MDTPSSLFQALFGVIFKNKAQLFVDDSITVESLKSNQVHKFYITTNEPPPRVAEDLQLPTLDK